MKQKPKVDFLLYWLLVSSVAKLQKHFILHQEEKQFISNTILQLCNKISEIIKFSEINNGKKQRQNQNRC